MKKSKNNLLKLNKSSIQLFIAENKNAIAAVGGIATGIALTSLLGSDRAKQILKVVGTSVMGISEKIREDLSEYKNLLAPLLGKSTAQGL